MAATNDLKALQEQIKQLRKEYQEIAGKPAALFDDTNIKNAKAAVDTLTKAIKEAENEAFKLEGGFEGLRSLVVEINKEFGKQTNFTKDFTKLYSKVESIAKNLQYDERGISELNAKQLKAYVTKLDKIKEEARFKAESIIKEKNIFDLNDKQFQTISEKSKQGIKLNEQEKKYLESRLNFGNKLDDKEKAILKAYIAQFPELEKLKKQSAERYEEEKKLEKSLGLVGGILKGISKIPILGDIVDAEDALTAMKDAGGGVKGLKAGLSNLKTQFIEGITNPANLAAGAITQMYLTLKSSDEATGNLAKSFDMSYNSAANLRMELTDIANFSGDVAVTTKGLQESMIAIGQTLGSNARLNKEDLVTFTKLREQAGYTNDELAGIQKLTLATGGSLEDNTASFLGSVAALNGQNKLTINAKQLLKEVANVSDSIKLSIGGTTEKLAEAAFKAKQFGINLQQADQISQGLLDFESSIANELSAELITGKDLNLERARLLAINGDIAGASAEILKQVGGTAEFTKMNRIQQEAIAKATGLSRDDLAKSLMDKEALVALSGVEGADAKEKYDNLVKQVGVEEAKKRLGNEQLANQFQQQSLQERFTQSIEKLKEVFVSLVEPLMPVLDIFASIFKIVGPIAGFVGTILKYTVQWGKWLLLAVGAYKTLQFFGDGVYRAQIVTNAAKKIGLMTDTQANAIVKGRQMLAAGEEMSEMRREGIKKRTLGTVIATNIQEKLGLATKEGGLLLTIKESAIKAKDFLLEKGKNALMFAGNVLKAAGNMLGLTGLGIQKAGNRSAGKGLLSKAGEFVLGMFSAGAKAPFPANIVLPFILGAVAGGIAAAMIGKYMKGDDVMSEGGYGNRTLLTPKGSIALNNNDTIIAGTNLGGKGKSNPAPQQDNSALIAEIRAMRQEQARANAKPTIVENNMNGTRFGTSVAMNTYKTQ